MKLNAISLAGLILVIFFGGIGASAALNLWQTESTKTAARFTQGDFAGQANPADIRGSYTFGDVERNFGVPLADLQSAFRLPAQTDSAPGSAAAFQVKNLETLTAGAPVEVGTASVRMFVAFYLGLPYDLSGSEETYLYAEAGDILRARQAMTPEQAAYLERHLITTDAAALPGASTPAEPGTEAVATEPAAAEDQPATVDQPKTEEPPEGEASVTEVAPAPTEHVAPAGTITGQTTFQQVLDEGVRPEVIEGILGGSLPDPHMLIRDYATQHGLAFSTLKTQLQAETDRLK